MATPQHHSSDPAQTIAIIGGGFSGATLAIHLSKLVRGNSSIHVVEPRPELGWGLAYGQADRAHILNVPADRMSLWSSQPRDFLEWAITHGPGLGWPQAGSAHSASYLPRRLFGHYVAHALDAAADAVHHHRARAVDLQRHQDRGFHITLDTGHHLAASHVVLATGYHPPALPVAVTGTCGPDRIIADPWPDRALSGIASHHHVLIMGTGLTMIDMIGSLDRAGHRGRITAISRHGLLPRLHGPHGQARPLLTSDDARRGICHCLATLRRAIADGRMDWRDAIDGLRPELNMLWQSLPPADQDRFLRHLRPQWEVHRHRMPAESADLLFRHMGQGRLTVRAARIGGMALTPDDIAVTLLPRHAHGTETIRVDRVINCTPPSPPFRADFDPCLPPHPAGTVQTPSGLYGDDRPDAAEIRSSLDNPLENRLRSAGYIRPDRCGLGLDVTPDGMAVDTQGRPVPGLWVLGPLRRGTLAESTAVPNIRPQIEALAQHLCRSPVPDGTGTVDAAARK